MYFPNNEKFDTLLQVFLKAIKITCNLNTSPCPLNSKGLKMEKQTPNPQTCKTSCTALIIS